MALYLITGGSGYFGECLVRLLLARGERVRVFDRNPVEGDLAGKVEMMIGDIRDLPAVVAATQGVDYVLHNVAQVPLAKEKQLFWSVNHLGTQNMLDAAVKAGVKKVVYTSSSAVFGVPKSNPVTETSPTDAAEEYGKAKREGEFLCREYAAKGLPVSIVRPRTIIGHGRLGIFQILFEWIHNGQNVPVFDDGKNVFQFVHADDLADAVLRAALAPGSETYNCGAEVYGTMRETLEALCRHAGTGSKVKSLPMKFMQALMHFTSSVGLSPLAPYHALLYGQNFYFDTGKLKRELGWSARYSNVQALTESYDWYVANREAVLRGGDEKSTHRRQVKQGILALLGRFL